MTNFIARSEKVPGQPLPKLPAETDLLLARLKADGIPVLPPGEAQPNLHLGLSDEAEVAGWLGQLGPDNSRPWVGIGPGSKMPAKRWPEERFRDVVQDLIKNFAVWPVVFGGSEDTALGDELLSAWGCGYNAAGALSLRGSAAALKHCTFLLTNDTGTMHLATAVGTPCVAIFSAREAPGMWFPYGAGHRVFRSDIECEGCRLVECIEMKNECLNRITTRQVYAGCEAMLRERSVESSAVG